MLKKALSGIALASLLISQANAQPKWEQKLDSDIRFKMVHDSGLVVVGTKQTVYGFNPETGAEKWKIEKVVKNYDPESVQPPYGSPYLIYVYKTGMFDTSPDVRCLNVLTGQEAWSKETNKPIYEITPQIAAYLGKEAKAEEAAIAIPSGYPTPFLSFLPDEQRSQFLLGAMSITLGIGPIVTGLAGDMVNAKPKIFQDGGIISYDQQTGDIKWVALIPEKSNDKKNKLTYQWSKPQIVGDKVIVDWSGLHVFNASDGSLVAGAGFDRKNLKGANAPTLVANGIAYVASAGQLRAVDINSGEIKWETKNDKKAAYADLQLAGDKLVVQRGGSFEEKKGKMKSFDFGIDVLDKNSGQPLFDSMKLHKSKEKRIGAMTNLIVDGAMVYFASAGNFRAFDLNALDYKYIVSLGEDQGKFDGIKSVALADDGTVYVLMNQSTKAFNPADGSMLWSKTFEPPKASGLALALLNATAAIAAQSQANRSGRTAKYKTYSQADFNQGASATSDAYNYVMTKEDKNPTIVGVNLATGEDDRRVTLDKKAADYIVDERFGTLVNVEKKKTIQIYDMN